MKNPYKTLCSYLDLTSFLPKDGKGNVMINFFYGFLSFAPGKRNVEQ